MCGHATLALGKWLVESGQVPAIEPETRFFLELPCGLIEVMCRVEKGAVTTAAFKSVPAFLSRAEVSLGVSGLDWATTDLDYGGSFHATLAASRMGSPMLRRQSWGGSEE